MSTRSEFRGIQWDVDAVVGADFLLIIPFTQDAAPHPWAGVTVTASIMSSGQAIQAITVSTAVAGQLTFSLTEAQAAAIGKGRYRWSVTFTIGAQTFPVLAGRFELHLSEVSAVTPPPASSIEVSPSGVTGAVPLGLPVTFGIGTVSTLPPGSPATASLTGSGSTRQLNLGLPAGATGPPNSLTVGSVSTGDPGSPAAASITGDAPAQQLNLTIPRGDVGSTGATGGAVVTASVTPPARVPGALWMYPTIGHLAFYTGSTWTPLSPATDNVASILGRSLVAFDERSATPTANLGTLGPAGDVVYTGTVRLAPSTTAYVRLPGVAGNTVACTAPAGVTQFEAVPLGGGASTTGAATGGAAFAFSTAGSWERVRLKNVGGDTLAEFVPPSDEGATGVTDAFSVAWTINRSTGATYKTEVVVPGTGSRLFNGTSDFGEVANLAGLNFGPSDSFTLFSLVRQWATPNTNGRYVSKRGTTGYLLSNNGTLAQGYAQGSTGAAAITRAIALGPLSLLALSRPGSLANASLTVDAGATSGADSSTDLSNANPLRVGREGTGSNYQHFRMYAWGVFPGVLTSAELAALRAGLLVPAA
jgi:hypothetical protein